MLKITLAETAGFCFGVSRAVQMRYDLVESGEKVCTHGPIIHHSQMVEELKSKGQMAWVAAMNGIKHSAEEIVLREFVYSMEVRK